MANLEVAFESADGSRWGRQIAKFGERQHLTNGAFSLQNVDLIGPKVENGPGYLEVTTLITHDRVGLCEVLFGTVDQAFEFEGIGKITAILNYHD